MKQPATFDHYAKTYDADFTQSAIGSIQRKQVWRALDQYLRPSMNILEINCGTGEDALRLARLGHSVLATDYSEEMIKTGRQKRSKIKEPLELRFQRLGFQELGHSLKDRKFDLIFSNFGGLNCISPFETRVLAERFHSFLKPGGLLFLVYMSKNCWWERFYHILKGQNKKANRRAKTGLVRAKLGEEMMNVWYFSPGELKEIYRPYFIKIDQKPVGLLVPPSYLETFFARRRRVLGVLDWFDRICPFSALADYADHFAIVFRKKSFFVKEPKK